MIPNPNLLKTSIFDVQEFLRTISQVYSEISPIVPDGLYGPQTTQSVIDFQKMKDMPQTGTVDFQTWQAIVRTYDDVVALRAPARAVQSFPSQNFTVSIEDEGDTVYFIQIMLNTLSKYYINISPVPISGRFDELTAKSVKDFQPCCGESPSGVVCKSTWDLLVNAYETCTGFC